MISVIVPHQLDRNRSYFNLCIESILRSHDIDSIEVLVIAGSETKPKVPSNVGLYWDREVITVADKLNLAMKMISKESTHFILISDDIVVSKYMLSDMHSAFMGREMIMNPMSNSDCISLYESDIFLGSRRIFPDMDMEDLSDEERELIMNFPRKPKCLIPFYTVSFYCTMIPLSVWEKVGPLDKDLEYRHNDQDYCIRAMKLGIPTVVNMGTFAFHFGSKTMRHLANDELKAKCSEHFQNKWQAQKTQT